MFFFILVVPNYEKLYLVKFTNTKSVFLQHFRTFIVVKSKYIMLRFTIDLFSWCLKIENFSRGFQHIWFQSLHIKKSCILLIRLKYYFLFPNTCSMFFYWLLKNNVLATFYLFLLCLHREYIIYIFSLC